jgi:hypothetical protein
MKRCTAMALFALSIASPISAQGVRGTIDQLFIFGDGEDPLFLGGSADPSNPEFIQAHGSHFIPAAVESNGTIIAFLTNAISTQIANIPFSSTSGGRTFRFEGGVPVATSTSPGPIFAERAQTLGRGRVLIGANVNVFRFKSVRGVGLHDISLNFAHENSDFPNCDQIFGGDCSVMGIPEFENEVIALDLSLNLDVTSTLFVMTYGLLDWIDVGVAVPIISTNLRGTSNAAVVPFGGASAPHFFSGTSDNPGLTASRTAEGSATGLGDLAARFKVRVAQSSTTAFAILGDARFATGSQQDLLGSGYFAGRGLGIVSAQFGAFSPHVNVGYLYRDGDLQNDAVLATVGFDHMLASWATLALDLISEFQVGESKLGLPEPVTVESPYRRTIEPTNIPTMRDDIVTGSVGFKFVTPSGVTIVANSLWPLNKGGLRTNVAWTAGLEYNF